MSGIWITKYDISIASLAFGFVFYQSKYPFDTEDFHRLIKPNVFEVFLLPLNELGLYFLMVVFPALFLSLIIIKFIS